MVEYKGGGQSVFKIAQKISRDASCMFPTTLRAMSYRERQIMAPYHHLLWIWDERCYKRLGLEPELVLDVDGPLAIARKVT